jgi:LuxR family transcriptional regulator, maltose regulon positive regulatory protein
MQGRQAVPGGGAVAALHQRTEGWAAGLRLAALSLTGHPDPDGFAAEFSGTERTVPEYLLAEVLDRQSDEVRRLLSVSTSTVKTHMRNLYAKLGAHSRAEAVESALALGLLAPSGHRR